MPPPGIVEALDVIKDIGRCVIAGRVDLAMPPGEAFDLTLPVGVTTTI